MTPSRLLCSLDSSVPDWIIDYPETLPLFERLGIDYCCGGKSLEVACQQRGLDPDFVLAMLRASIEAKAVRLPE